MKNKTLLLDTNVLITYFQDSVEILDTTLISRISYIELLSYSNFSENEVREVKYQLNQTFQIVEIKEFISDLAAQLQRKIKGLRLADSIILASTLATESELKTYDKRLLKYYKNLHS